MGNNTAITVRLPRELGEKLQMLAHRLSRATSDLAGKMGAILGYR